MNNFFDNLWILNLIWKRKFHFVIVGIIAIILSGIFSGPAFIAPKFKSTARIYPINLAVLSNESETEQMLEIVNSNDIKFKIFDAFRLHESYKINPDDPHYITYMLDKYNTNVNVSKTEFETVEVKVLDTDPNRASDMCDSIIAFYSDKVRQMHKAKEWEMVVIINKQINKKNAELDTVMSRLNLIRKDYGILDYKSQVEEVTQGYMTALATGKGSSGDTKKIQEFYSNLSEKGTEAQFLEVKMDSLIGSIYTLTNQYDTYLSEFEKDITYAHIVEYPRPADKKSYPVRWLIVAFSTISAVFLALLMFMVLDYRKQE